MLFEPPLRDFVTPRETDGETYFTLKEGILVGRKR
jgi:hypothetical protein